MTGMKKWSCIKKSNGETLMEHYRLFLHTKIYRISHDETRAGKQKEEN
jgi:hypothetical protein